MTDGSNLIYMYNVHIASTRKMAHYTRIRFIYMSCTLQRHVHLIDNHCLCHQPADCGQLHSEI